MVLLRPLGQVAAGPGCWEILSAHPNSKQCCDLQDMYTLALRQQVESEPFSRLTNTRILLTQCVRVRERGFALQSSVAVAMPLVMR